MVFTTVGFYESQACDGLTLVAAMDDQHVTISLDDITVPSVNQLMGIMAFGEHMSQVRIVSPSLRRMWNLDVHPHLYHTDLPRQQAVNEGGAATFSIPQGLGYMDLHENPIPLVTSEKLNVQIANQNNNEPQNVIIFLCDGTPTPRKGIIYTLRCTNTDTLTANVWTNGALTFGQSLPAGRYAVVGMAYQSNSAVAARLVFVGEAWRPGCLGKSTYSDYRPPIFRFGKLGVFGEFEFDQPPTVDFLADAADSAQQVWLDLIQIRAGR